MDMPARSAQLAPPPAGPLGSMDPLDCSMPALPGPAPLTSDGIRAGGGAGSPLVVDPTAWSPGAPNVHAQGTPYRDNGRVPTDGTTLPRVPGGADGILSGMGD